MGETQFSRRVVSAMAWSGPAVLAAKVIGIVSQIFLGYLLLRNDFAVYAFAGALFAVLSPISENGIQKLVVVYSKSERERVYVLRRLAYATAGVLAVCLVVVAIVLSSTGNKQVAIILASHLPILVLATAVGICRALLQLAFDFRTLAGASTLGALTKGVAVIAAAAVGFGALSFVIALVVGKVVELALLLPKSNASYRTADGDSTSEMQRELRVAFRWIVVAALITSLATSADYLILGLFSRDDILGPYYFGYQSVAALSTVLVSGAIGAVFLPAFATINSTDKRRVLVSATESLILVTAPIFVILSFATRAAFNVIWGDRWLDAAVVAALMLLALTTRIASPILRSYLEATGQWRKQTFLLSLDATLLSIVVCVTCMFGDRVGTVEFAAVVAGYRFLYGCFLILYVYAMGIHDSNGMQSVSLPLLALASMGGGYLAYKLSGTEIAGGVIFITVWAVVSFTYRPIRERYCSAFAQVRAMRGAHG